jgi:O-antigen ligase
LAIRGRLGRWELALVATVLAVGLGLLLWIGPGSIVDHFRVAESGQNEPSLVTRILISKTTLKAFLGFPVLGTGLSTFPAAFLHYYPAGDEKVWLQAHNDYAQILLETGIVGSVIAALGLLVLSTQLLGPIAGRQQVGERLIYYALCISILSLMIHSVVDFNLHVPANAALFVVVLAMALAQRSLLRRSPSREA